jgi:arsenite methyltransferase
MIMNRTDRWHRWLLDVRFGGDAEAHQQALTDLLYPIRARVLDGARLRPGETLLDVGAGDGLIAFGALEQLGSSGRVIFSDISQDLLDHCRTAAAAEGALDRCSFVQGSADSLDGVPSTSVDVVTTRSVLIYVKDKAAALHEFYRVLKPGGRISLAEPINALMGVNDPTRFSGYDIRPVAALARKVRSLYESIQPPGTDPMVDFDERDLLSYTEQAGFPVIDLDLHVEVKNAKLPVPWARFLRMSGNPLVPPLGEALERTLTAAEIADFTAHLKPLVEAGAGQERVVFAYLTALKQ